MQGDAVPYEPYGGGLSEEQRDDLVDLLNLPRVSIWDDEEELDGGHFTGRGLRYWLDAIGHPSAHAGCCQSCGCCTTCMGGAFFDATVSTVLRELNRHGLLRAPESEDR